MREVLVIQRVLTHYRVPFFEKLHEQLADSGISLQLLYGYELPGTVPKTTPIGHAWAHLVPNRYLGSGDSAAVWQPAIAHLAGKDLIIVEQANRLLLNYVLHVRRKLNRSLLAYWGHGRNFQARRSTPGLLRRRLMLDVDWWFAYTDASMPSLLEAGFSEDRITVVNNAIDTSWMRCSGNSQLHTKCSGRTAIFCGGLYHRKRLDFLLEAAGRVRQQLNGFELLVIGEGPEQEKVIRASNEHDWINYVGAKYGRDTLPYFRTARIQLMPGLVGLAALDSFATATPLATVQADYHSPEFSYLQNGYNAVISEPDISAYANAVVAYLTDQELSSSIVQGCLESADRYTLDQMVNRFAAGIRKCLG